MDLFLIKITKRFGEFKCNFYSVKLVRQICLDTVMGANSPLVSIRF